ncbi:hypothetical protein AQZ49_19850 [Novosphingobium sp. FSW06-99]|nr:hypothetical protein AQZ49_19850 [Novosphingobium sp. FSW06-99]
MPIGIRPFMNINHTESMAMSADKHNRPANHHRTPAPQPDYNDEISDVQIEAIRRLADPEAKRSSKRVVLYPHVA